MTLDLSLSRVSSLSIFPRRNRISWFLLFLMVFSSGVRAFAAASTSTTLTVTNGSSAVTSVPVGTAITLTANVASGASLVTPGQVLFCDTSVNARCRDLSLLGTAQVTANGIASIKLRLGSGTHTLQAIFSGTTAYTSSESATQTLTVTSPAPYPSITTSSWTLGTVPGTYNLTSIVTGLGVATTSPAPTGTVHFLETSDSNAEVASATLVGGSYSEGFTPISVCPTGISCGPFAVGDFNGDGLPDLAVIDVQSVTSSSVTLWLGNGDGTFQQSKTIATGNGIFSAIAAGDFNNDGRLDLAWTNSSANTVSILLNNGDGNFQAPKSFATGSDSDAVATGDFNGDGTLDLVVANLGDSTLSVLLGNGDGTLQPQVTYIPIEGGVGAFFDVAVADFNGDGKLDILAPSADFGASILLGNGDGTFKSPLSLNAGGVKASVADFNSDGKLDIALQNQDGPVEVVLGNGDGTFQPLVTYADGQEGTDIGFGDFNGDGIVDLAVAVDGLYGVLLGNGDGTFQTVKRFSNVPTGAFSLAVADFNGDGKTDLGISLSNISILLNTIGVQSKATSTGVILNGSPTVPHLVTASYSGDANYTPSISGVISPVTAKTQTTTRLSSPIAPPPLVLSNPSPAIFSAYVSTNGPVSAGQVMFCDNLINTTCTDAALLGTVQVNSSGEATLSTRLGYGQHQVQAIYTGTDTFSPSNSPEISVTQKWKPGASFSHITSTPGAIAGTYTLSATLTGLAAEPNPPAPTGTVSFIDTSAGNAVVAQGALTADSNLLDFYSIYPPYVGIRPTKAILGDFNGDGIADIASINSGGPNAVASISVLLGNGDGSSQLQRVTTLSGFFPHHAVAGDFNGDGKLDLAVVGGATDTGNNIEVVLLGKQDGTFQAPVSFNVGKDIVDLATGDFNADGKLDLVLSDASSSSPAVWVVLGKGNGTFGTGQAYTVGGTPDSVAVGDFNGDGISDLAVSSEASKSISVLLGHGDLLGNGDGTFQAGTTTAADANAYTQLVTVADLNGDGKLDLLSVPLGSNSVLVQLGNGDGTFQSPQSYALPGETGAIATSIAVVDLNFDGKPDLAVTNSSYHGSISVLLGKGDGTFPTPPQVFPVGTNPSSIVAGDLNGDGKPDLAIANFGSTSTFNPERISVLLNWWGATATVSVPVSISETGTHEIKAYFPGDANYRQANSAPTPLSGAEVPLASVKKTAQQ